MRRGAGALVSAGSTRCGAAAPADLNNCTEGGLGQDPASEPYHYCYCGASHAELWRIQHSPDEVQTPGGQTTFVPRAQVVTVNAALRVCVDAVSYPGRPLFCPCWAAQHRLLHRTPPLREANSRGADTDQTVRPPVLTPKASTAMNPLNKPAKRTNIN